MPDSAREYHSALERELQPHGLPQHQLIHDGDTLIAVGDRRLVLVLVVVLLDLVPVYVTGLWSAGHVSLRRVRVARARTQSKMLSATLSESRLELRAAG